MALFEELKDTAVPGSDVGKELLEAFYATPGEGGDAFVGAVVDKKDAFFVSLNTECEGVLLW